MSRSAQKNDAFQPFWKRLITQPDSVVSFPVFFTLIMLLELAAGVFIIRKVAYTEIDWIAYMQEVGGFLSGETDYMNLKGDTGPLVYPAGFVYLYSAFYWITSQGQNILLAQYLFLGLYLIHQAILLIIYREAKMSYWVMLLLCASRRIHSIFMLRLFNDCIAMIFAYAAVLLFIRNRWTLGCIAFSLGVSIKMNVLLFAPPLAVLLMQRFGIIASIPKLLYCAAVQIVLGLPFLLTFPKSYFGRAFEFGRQFFYKWTVNWKFLEEEQFLSPQLALSLLGGHLIVLLLFCNFKWCWQEGGIWGVLRKHITKPLLFARNATDNLPASRIASLMFVGNFIGLVFCRTIHYQFYVWYYGTLPFLLFQTHLWTPIRLAILVGVEVAFNVFPATWWSSALLQACHWTLLVALFMSSRAKPAPVNTAASTRKAQ